jgi:hypothetical protein
MAQQMITLEEAAEKLGISPEEMKKRLKTDPEFRRLSQIRDGSTVRFKLSAIEELARQLGMASDQGLPMAPMAEDEPPGSDDFKVPGIDDKKSKKADDQPLEFGSSEDDVFSLADEPAPAAPSPKSSGKLTPNKPGKDKPAKDKGMSDSSAGSSDSDVRLDGGKAKKTAEEAKKPADEATVPTEEIALDFSGPGSAVIKGGSSAKLSAPTPKSSGKLAAPDSGKSAAKGKGPAKGSAKPPSDSSEFELSLDADSDDFELQMNPDAGDEVDLGSLPKEKSGGASSGRASKSGINLRDPADSGISLEKGKEKEKEAAEKAAKEQKKKTGDSSSDSDVDFELSLDSSAVASSTKLGAPKSGKLVLDSDSDSEFELTLDDSGGSSLEQAALGADASDDAADKGDIFETDFEIPPMPDESGSEAVALESDTDLEKSDFELAMDDSDVAAEEPSASEVVLLEDEEEAPKKGPKSKAPTKVKPKKVAESTEEGDVDLADVEPADEDDASVSKALKGAKGKKRGADEDEDEEAAPAGTVVERPTKPWGIIPALFLTPTLLVVLLGALMGYEMLQTMWGYQQPRKPAAPIIRGLATNLDMPLNDQ